MSSRPSGSIYRQLVVIFSLRAGRRQIDRDASPFLPGKFIGTHGDRQIGATETVIVFGAVPLDPQIRRRSMYVPKD